MDKFQKRYIKHQERKKDIIQNGEQFINNEYSEEQIRGVAKMFYHRHSSRILKGKIDNRIVKTIIDVANLAPSSCNRHGVQLVKAPKNLIPLLVGGKGWCDNGTVLAFYADMDCYKSEYEKDFMPYLDTGFMAQNIYLFCEVMGIGCCFINPNTHNKYKTNKLLTGAISLGVCF